MSASEETPVFEPGAGEPPPPSLKLFLLGRFEVVRDGTPVPAHAWRRRRPADLLKLVALAPGRTLTREQAVTTLWPEKDPASGANNLHRALYDLREVLGGRWLDLAHGQLALVPSAWLDVDAFEAAVSAGTPETLAEAVALYRGDLHGQDPWLAERRSALRRLFAAAVAPLARQAARALDETSAVPLLRRLVDVDPLDEEAYRDLMRLLAVGGRRSEALLAYAACESAREAAGRGPPGEETRALRNAIRLGTVAQADGGQRADGARRACQRLLGTSDPAPVRGREAMLLLLEELVERGAGMLVLLGERGVGKTRLALEGARLAQSQGARVLSATAAPFAGSPYGIFSDLFQHEPHGAGDPLALVPGLSSEEHRRVIHRAVAAELSALSQGGPLYLLLDDLHAADESSLNLVHELALRAAELRALIVATCRDDEVHEGTPIQMALSHLDLAHLARGIRLPRLSLSGTRAQVADLLGAPPADPLLTQVYRATDGSPFLIEETVRVHRESGQVPTYPEVALRARVARLGPRAEALLTAAAVAGRRFDLEVVRPVSGLAPHDALSTLEECLADGLLDEDGTGYLFRHELVREALYQGLAGARRSALHAALADALEAAGDDRPELLAVHRRRAGQLDRALRHLVAAGHRAAARACLSEARGFYLQALDLPPRAGMDGPLRREVLDACGRVQLALGDGAGAARCFDEVARMPLQEGPGAAGLHARSRRLAATALVATGDLRGALAAIAEGVAAAGSAAEEDRAALLHLAAQIHYHAGRAGDAVTAAKACAEAAERAGDADLTARGRDLVAVARSLAGEPMPPVEETAARPIRFLQDVLPEHPIDVHLVLWDRDLLGDRTCAEVGRAALVISERARERRAPAVVASAGYGEGVAALAAGELDRAEELLGVARSGFHELSFGLGEALATERLATLFTQRGRFEEAERLVSEAVVLAERSTLRRHVLTRLHCAEVRQRLAAGLPGQAGAAAREAEESAARHGECLACQALLRPETVRVALAFGRLDDAEAETRALEEVAQQGGRALQALAQFARARVLAARERRDDALGILAQARAGFLAAGFRYEAARTARLEARLLGSQPDDLRELDRMVVAELDA